MADIDGFLKEREEAGLLRNLTSILGRHSGTVRVGSQEYVDFSSNDYLGLSGHPRLVNAAKQAIDEFGTSSSASRLLSGDLVVHHQLEEDIAEFKHKDAALVFNSGYQANCGIISSFLTKDDCVFSDRLNHASIFDGIALSGARLFRFRHNDAGHLESLLKKERAQYQHALIISETVFSMDGDICPLKDFVRLKEKYNCQILVDEAHATGVFGRRGAGIVEREGLEQQVDFIMGTFSKALGGFGAYVAASKKAIAYLINTSRSFIYSTALPPGVIASDRESIRIINDEPWRRQKLLDSAGYLRGALQSKGFEVTGDSQIIPLILGDNRTTVSCAQELREKGYWVFPIRPPTVPPGQARIRFSLTLYHTQEILNKLIDDISVLRV